MAKTLDEGLSQLFGTDFRTEGTANTPSGDSDSTIMTYDEAISQIKSAYQNAKTSAQSGNWADYGRYLEQLEQAINQLDKSNSVSAQSDVETDQTETISYTTTDAL